jgi:anti-sigma factor ChrR (cupin superfamily)
VSAQTRAAALAPGAVVLAPHPVTGTGTVARTVAKVTIHPVDGITVYYTDGQAPSFHAPGAVVKTQ